MQPAHTKLVIASALMSVPYLAMAIWLAQQGVPCSAGYLLASGLLVAAPAVIVKSPKYWLLLNLPCFVTASALASFTIVQGALPSYPIAFVLVTTSWNEISEYFAVWQNARILLGVGGILLGYLLLAFGLPSCMNLPWNPRLAQRATIAFFALLAAISASNPASLIEGVWASPLVGTIAFLCGPLSSAKITVQGGFASKNPYFPARVEGPQIDILIVGESVRRDSWSVFGYSRSTTPYLESIKSEMVLFDNAEADGNITVYAVPALLTGFNPERLGTSPIRGNLIDLAGEAGYFTAWLVNNDASISYMLGIRADVSTYPHSSTATITRSSPPDGLLLPEFKRQLSRPDPRKFIGMHLFGSHLGYSHRYPGSFARWGSQGSSVVSASTEQQLLDTYDNSLLYTDWFLQQVIEAVRSLDVPVTVTFVADHGEELPSLDGRLGHGLTWYTPKAFEIPAFVWTNPAYRHLHPDKVRAMQANESKLVRSHDFFFSLADLMGIRWPGFDPRRSVASESFVPDVDSRYYAGGTLVVRTQ